MSKTKIIILKPDLKLVNDCILQLELLNVIDKKSKKQIIDKTKTAYISNNYSKNLVSSDIEFDEIFKENK